MKNKQHFLERISNPTVLLLIIVIFSLKTTIYILIKSNFLNINLGGGSDAYYYDAYAIGNINIALNLWPVMLRYLDNFGLYSRDTISYFLFLINMIAVPITVAKLARLNLKQNQKYYLYILLLCSIYPTLFFFSFDIYRDVFMVFSFLIGCIVVQSCLNSPNYLKFFTLFLISILIGFFLSALRPYLGYAFLVSLFLWKIRFTKKRIVFLGVLYFTALFIFNYVGALDSLTEYRSAFEEDEGGSTLGLNFSNPLLFIPNFILSFLGQMLGLYITNLLSVVLLLVETIPFFFMLIYVIKNINISDKFVRFLIIFFVVYGSVWLIGNDNLGTAVRLRFYNYFAIYICFFYILRLKTSYSNKS